MTLEQKALIKEWLTLTQFIGPKSAPPGVAALAWSAIQELVDKALTSDNELDCVFFGQKIYEAYGQAAAQHPLGAVMSMMGGNGSTHPNMAMNIGYVAGILYGMGLSELVATKSDKNLQAMIDARKEADAKKPVDFASYRKAQRT